MQEPVIQFSHVSMEFPGVLANDDVSLTVHKGEIFALVGENGAGKSTLMNILYGIHTPTGGSLTVKGQEIAHFSPKAAIELGVGMVHQHFMLVPSLTVTENIIMGMEPVKGIRVDLAYARQQVEEMGKKFNLYVDPDKRVEDLTVGQKQRVEILKALFRGAKILILDEATSSVDTRTERHIEHGMDRLMADRTTLVIAHRLSTVRNANAIMVLENGEIIERGDHDQLLEQKGRYYELYTGKKQLA